MEYTIKQWIDLGIYFLGMIALGVAIYNISAIATRKNIINKLMKGMDGKWD